MKRSYLKRGTSQMKRTPFKRGTSQMKRTSINKVGPVGRANLAANKKLKDVLSDIDSCEIQLHECLGSFTMANAHRHKRSWYQGDVELLSDRNQVVKACVSCHDKIEFDSELTEKVFLRLRGVEKYVDKPVGNVRKNEG